MCLRNLLRRRARTSLCVFGVALGVMFIIAVGATTTRYITIVREMNVFYSGSVVVVARGSIFVQAFSIAGFLPESKLNEVDGVEGVNAAVPMLFIIGTPAQEGVIQLVPSNISVGIPTGNWSVLIGTTPLKPGGNWPSASSGEKEAVIGISLSMEHSLTVNSKIRIKTHELRVVGILDTPSAFLARTIIMPIETAQEVYGYEMFISMLVVEPEDGITEEELADRIEAEVLGVSALTSDEKNQFIEPIFRDLELWNLGIGSAIFLMSMVLVMTVAVMNVSERRKELATLDAIGAPKSSIVRIVVTETGLIGLFGGIVGIPLGTTAALLITHFYTEIPMSLIFPWWLDIVPPTMMFKILVSAVALSCLAGIIPAITAARKSITEALRSEH